MGEEEEGGGGATRGAGSGTGGGGEGRVGVEGLAPSTRLPRLLERFRFFWPPKNGMAAIELRKIERRSSARARQTEKVGTFDERRTNRSLYLDRSQESTHCAVRRALSLLFDTIRHSPSMSCTV